MRHKFLCPIAPFNDQFDFIAGRGVDEEDYGVQYRVRASRKFNAQKCERVNDEEAKRTLRKAGFRPRQWSESARLGEVPHLPDTYLTSKVEQLLGVTPVPLISTYNSGWLWCTKTSFWPDLLK